MSEVRNYFTELFKVNVSDKIEKKNGLSYVSWVYAWAEIKKMYPGAYYTIYENKDGWNYHTDGKTCWVKTGMTVNGIEHIEYLPVMDFKNRSIPADAVTSMDVNKAIQRSLTKAAARHGLGLYVYAGEDLPEDEAIAQKEQQKEELKAPVNPKKDAPATASTGNKVPSISKEMKYLHEQLGKLANEREEPLDKIKELFKTVKKKAVSDGVAPDKELSQYTIAEIAVIVDLMRAGAVA